MSAFLKQLLILMILTADISIVHLSKQVTSVNLCTSPNSLELSASVVPPIIFLKREVLKALTYKYSYVNMALSFACFHFLLSIVSPCRPNSCTHFNSPLRFDLSTSSVRNKSIEVFALLTHANACKCMHAPNVHLEVMQACCKY